MITGGEWHSRSFTACGCSSAQSKTRVVRDLNKNQAGLEEGAGRRTTQPWD